MLTMFTMGEDETVSVPPATPPPPKMQEIQKVFIFYWEVHVHVFSLSDALYLKGVLWQ